MEWDNLLICGNCFEWISVIFWVFKYKFYFLSAVQNKNLATLKEENEKYMNIFVYKETKLLWFYYIIFLTFI